jgi:NADPH:quinone reductase-like Zn-dependent oxidoreductase
MLLCTCYVISLDANPSYLSLSLLFCLQEDLKFLFTLLATRKIRPKIDRFITLNGIRQAHDDMQNRGIIGSIICEPWKET